MFKLTQECAKPEWQDWDIHYWCCNIDEPVWQKWSDPKK